MQPKADINDLPHKMLSDAKAYLGRLRSERQIAKAHFDVLHLEFEKLANPSAEERINMKAIDDGFLKDELRANVEREKVEEYITALEAEIHNRGEEILATVRRIGRALEEDIRRHVESGKA
jgi:hypothetical protein